MTGTFRRRLARDQRGVTILEFAFVAPVLLLMLMGFFDLAHRAYVATVLQGAIEQAGRYSTLESGQANLTAINTAVQTQVRRTIGPDARFTADRTSYNNFSDIGQPEVYLDTKPKNGRYDLGECFEDMNANGVWDADRGRAGSQGGAQDIAVYKITVTFPRLFPMAGMLGWSAEQSVSGSTVLRNQPWAAQAIAPKCS